MTVLRALSAPRRWLVAVALVAVAVAVPGAGLPHAAHAAHAEATTSSGTSARATVAATASPADTNTDAPVGEPVEVPADATFALDVVPVTVTPDPGPATAGHASRSAARGATPSGSVREVAAATLAQVPASQGVTLLFDHPQLGGHLGAVFMGSPGYLLLSASRLAGDPAKTADVVRHEIAHVYQARLAATRDFGTVDARMTELFGANGLERAADCVALALGASWTHYTSDCSGPGQADAVDALLSGRMP